MAWAGRSGAVCLAFGLAASTTVHAQDEPIAEPFAPGVMSFSDKITLTPAFSPDGLTAYFPQSDCARIGPCPQLMYIARKVDGTWQAGGKLGLSERGYNGRTARVDWPSVGPDGRWLYFSWSGAGSDAGNNPDVAEDFALWRLDLHSPSAKPERLRGPDLDRVRGGEVARLRFVNNETSPIVTRSGRLYFWTERLDGTGERDLYRAEPDGTGGFEQPMPLPAPLNSAGRDNHLWINAEETVALVTYNERGGEGGDDIFISRKAGGRWSEPENLGPLVNGPAQDFAARPTPDGDTLVFTSTRSGVLSVWSLPVRALIHAGTVRPSDFVPVQARD